MDKAEAEEEESLGKLTIKSMRKRIGRDLQFPMRPGDLEDAIATLGHSGLLIELYFFDRTAFSKRERDERKLLGRYRLVEMEYRPLIE